MEESKSLDSYVVTADYVKRRQKCEDEAKLHIAYRLLNYHMQLYPFGPWEYMFKEGTFHTEDTWCSLMDKMADNGFEANVTCGVLKMDMPGRTNEIGTYSIFKWKVIIS